MRLGPRSAVDRSSVMPRPVAGLLLVVLLLIASNQTGLAANGLTDGWMTYRDRFITADGRVLDSGNNGITHSEGQGWGMLFAETVGDRATFDRLWSWTRRALQRKDSSLFSWKWDPRDRVPISDPNDASDGDITIAWALSRAAERWNTISYRNAAEEIAADIRHMLLCVVHRRLVLLPGRDGFRQHDRTIVNLSYYIYPAFVMFARIDPSPEWQQLRRDGLQLLAQARFGRWRLPPDWLVLDDRGEVAPAPNLPPRFGFDAVRIPLYLVWGDAATPERLASYLDYWSDLEAQPVAGWADLSNDTLAPFPGSTGLHAIAQLVLTYQARKPMSLPKIGATDDYYSASLVLLSRIAQRESARP